MNSSKTKAAPVGSVQWVENEKDQVSRLVGEDVAEFSYSVRNELEWLNEHMGDIFSKSQMNFADMFKTPSRMRGKTPRTNRKRDGLPTRQPLTDIFAPNAQSTPSGIQAIDFSNKTINLPIPNNEENLVPQHQPISRGKSPNRAGIPYTDSGYHGMTEDEMEIYTQPYSVADSTQSQGSVLAPIASEIQIAPEQSKEGKADETGTSEESFVSAEEAVVAKVMPTHLQTATQQSDEATIPDDEMPLAQIAEKQVAPVEEQQAPDNVEPISMDLDNQSQSDLSSPENPLQRKSSFAFSALPAREPLGAKRSMGNRNSQIDFQSISVGTVSKSVEGKLAEAAQPDPEEENVQQPVEPEVRSKTSMQLLQERITMLGKTKEPRPSKSIPPNALAPQAAYPQLPEVEPRATAAVTSVPPVVAGPVQVGSAVVDDDDDWIAPMKTLPSVLQSQSSSQSLSPIRPSLHHKSISASNLQSASKGNLAATLTHHKASSISHPNLADTLQSTTPVGSPVNKKTNEGTISASKNRLWSAFKSAKNIFASSASASAAAKLEAYKSSPSPKRDFLDDAQSTAVFNMPGALYSDRELPQSPSRPISMMSMSPKRTRSSTGNDRRREKEAKEQQKSTTNLEKAREQERQKATKQRLEETSKQEQTTVSETDQELVFESTITQERAPSVDIDQPRTNSKPMASFKSSILSSGKLRAPGRPVRPTRGATQSKPAPVSIRVASQSQRLGQGQMGAASLSKSQHEGSASTPASNDAPTSRPNSAQGNKSGATAPVNARLKALEAAARKKEADERAAQKKAEQKRELERKRALKAEEERRADEERKAAEQQRLQESKLAAQRKAEKQAEARRREQERAEQQRREQERLEQERRREQERVEQQRREQERLEQLRLQEEARKAREAHELAEKISRERAQQAQQSYPRGDVGGTIRQLIKHTIPQLNPAKPAKRHMQPEDEEPVPAPHRPPTQRGPPSYQQTDAKRRRTNEEQDEPDQRRSVMAPPKRPSNLRKETLSKFPHGYTHASGMTATHHGPSMFKAAVTAQHQMHHVVKGPLSTHPSQMVQISNARIPFAENNNPPATHHATNSQLHPGHENGYPSASTNKFKTPARPGHGPKSAKSSPLYQNGDHIALPEIATDSEDEESDEEDGTGFRAPSWVASPALRELLTQQQLVDPETVFGPIAELKMDEVFRGAKNAERMKKFRDRSSSALWIESGDAVTSAEKRRDMQMRERVAREGGWRYEPGA